MVEAIENLKPGLKEQILARLDEIDAKKGGEPVTNRMLSLVPEQEEQEEATSALLQKKKVED